MEDRSKSTTCGTTSRHHVTPETFLYNNKSPSGLSGRGGRGLNKKHHRSFENRASEIELIRPPSSPTISCPNGPYALSKGLRARNGHP